MCSTMFGETLAHFVSIILAVSTLQSGGESSGVIIDPKHTQVNESEPVTVRCTADPVEPISACQFRIWYVDRQKQGVLLNVSAINSTVFVTIPHPYQNDATYKATLFGGEDSFKKGICDLNLSKCKGDNLLVGCKVTTMSKFSSVKTMSVFVSKSKPLALADNEETLFVNPGSSVNVTLRTYDKVHLVNCSSATFDQQKITITRDNFTGNNTVTYPNGSPASPRFTPVGGMLSQGQCGFTISNVTEKDSGVFFVLARGEDGSVGAKAVTLVVQGPEHPPGITVTFSKDTQEFEVGEMVTATCTARGVRQVATRWRWWWRDGATNTEEPIAQFQTVDGWSWPWENVTQSVTLTLTRQRRSDSLMCSVAFQGESLQTESNKQHDSNVTAIAAWVLAALLAVAFVTACYVVCHRKILACFTERKVQLSAAKNTTPNRSKTELIDATARWRKVPPLRACATQPEAAQAQDESVAAQRQDVPVSAQAQDESVQYAEIARAGDATAQAQGTRAEVNEEVAYVELGWSR